MVIKMRLIVARVWPPRAITTCMQKLPQFVRGEGFRYRKRNAQRLSNAGIVSRQMWDLRSGYGSIKISIEVVQGMENIEIWIDLIQLNHGNNYNHNYIHNHFISIIHFH